MVRSVHAGSPVRSMRRHMVRAGLAGLVVAPLVAAGLAGTRGAVSALVGAGLVTLVMFLGFAGITAVTNGPTGLSMAGAVVVFVGQFLLLLLAIALLRDAAWVHGPALSIAAIMQVVVLQVGQVAGYLRGRHILVPHLPAGAMTGPDGHLSHVPGEGR